MIFLETTTQTASETYRMPAIKIRTADVVNGKYFYPKPEEKKAGYVITPFGKRIFRINVVATVIDKFVNEDESYCSLTLDDGTENIKMKAFKRDAKSLMRFELGDLILAVGKLREYNREVYIAAEAVRKLNDANYESMRRLELLNELLASKLMVDELRIIHDEASIEELKEIAVKKFSLDEEQLNVVLENLNIKKEIDYKPKVLEIINNLDSGKGVEMHKLFEQAELPESAVESAINDLLAEGMIFEPLPGVLKKV